MPTLAEVRRHRASVEDLTDLAAEELREFLRGLLDADPRKVAALVREFLPELAATYTLATSTVAADWYDDLRAEAAVAASFTAVTLDAPEADPLQDAIGYALVPLFTGTPTPADAESRLGNLVDEIVASADQQTVEANVALDRAAPRYARHASANACAFCRMLATRGAEYRTEESATRVVLSNRRNTREQGETYHENCHCTAVPVWDAVTYEEAPYVADWREAYYAATETLGGATDTKAILSLMRQSLGIQH